MEACRPASKFGIPCVALQQSSSAAPLADWQVTIGSEQAVMRTVGEARLIRQVGQDQQDPDSAAPGKIEDCKAAQLFCL